MMVGPDRLSPIWFPLERLLPALWLPGRFTSGSKSRRYSCLKGCGGDTPCRPRPVLKPHQFMLSVICPTYNRAAFLRECVVRLMGLPAGQVEVVVVDDASRDNTLEVCWDLVARYGPERLRCVNLATNSGAQAARNRGISEARGDCLMFVDSDDVPVAEGIVALQRKLTEDPKLDYVYGKVVQTNDQLVPLVSRESVGTAYDGSPVEVVGYHWHTMGAMYRRRCIDKVGHWNTELTGSQDWEYQARVKLLGGHGEFVDVLVGYWRQHEGSRVGARKFRPDYLESVMKGTESVLLEAEHAGRADAALRRRLAKRLLVHAFELGANARSADKRRCCRQAVQAAPCDPIVRMLGFVIANSPQCVDRWWCRRLERARARN